MLTRKLTLASLLTVLSLHTVADSFSQQQVDTARLLIEAGLQDRRAYAIVESLTTEIGPRLAGTDAEARAREWATAKATELGFDSVRIEEFDLPVWERGIEKAAIVEPFPQPLVITALGGSSSTGAAGVEGEVSAFASLRELQQQPDNSLPGHIIFIDEAMSRTQDGSSYSVAVAKRREAAYEAKRVGGVAALIRSVGTSSHRFAHTGQMRRVGTSEATGVPAAALSAPDADQLGRALARSERVMVALTLTPERRPQGRSGNVVAEWRGAEAADEIVLVGAHLDSWDLGTGAVDDGAGVGIVLAATRLLMEQMPRRPKRSIRVVLFGAEEVGLLGAKAYAEKHKDNLNQHVVGTESDFGAGRIWKFDTGVADSVTGDVMQIAQLLAPLGVAPGDNSASGGPDMTFLRQAGMPVVGLKQNGWDYFDLHHTPNDTFDKIDPDQLAQNVAAYAVFLYLAAYSDIDFR